MKARSLQLGLLLLFTSLGPNRIAFAQTETCSSSWSVALGQRPGFSGSSHAVVPWEDGGGEALFVVEGADRDGEAGALLRKWDGVLWHDVFFEAGLSLSRLVVHDDGAGPQLFGAGWRYVAAGDYVSGVYRFSGSSWALVGGAMEVPYGVPQFDDLLSMSSGPVPGLAISGTFKTLEGTPVSSNLVWSGSSWVSLGSPDVPPARSFALFDDGGGETLYLAATFRDSSGAVLAELGRWQGQDWEPIPSGLLGRVLVLSTYPDRETGAPWLIAGGEMSLTGASGRYVLRWNGREWSDMGNAPNHFIRELALFEGPEGPELFAGWAAGTTFGSCLATPNSGEGLVAKWDGWTWSFPDGGFSSRRPKSVDQLVQWGTGSNAQLIASGDFDFAENCGLPLRNLAAWNGDSWGPLGRGLDRMVIQDSAVFDDGEGEAIYFAGYHRSHEGSGSGQNLLCTRGFVAKWTGTEFVSIAQKIEGEVFSLLAHDDGVETALIVQGKFIEIDGVPVNNIARWDGVSWSPIASGIANDAFYELVTYDDGSGSDLVATGDFFDYLSGEFSYGLARFDGVWWTELSPASSLVDGVVDLHTMGFGGTDQLLACAYNYSSAPIAGILQFDGQNWVPVGGGVTAPSDYQVAKMESFDDGTGDALYVAGSFTEVGGVPAEHIARWDGTEWTSVGASTAPPFSSIFDLEVHEDGSGPALYVFGFLSTSTFPASTGMARWDGDAWTLLADLPFLLPNRVQSFDAGQGATLYVAGSDLSLPVAEEGSIVSWRGCSEGSRSFCFGGQAEAGACSPCPCGNASSFRAERGCRNSSGRGAQLAATGSASLANDTLRFEMRGATPFALSILGSSAFELPQPWDCAGLGANSLLDGLRCLAGSITRHGARQADGLGAVGHSGPGWGGSDGTSLSQSSGWASGQTRHFQVFYRDVTTTACGTGRNTTNGVSVTFR